MKQTRKTLTTLVSVIAAPFLIYGAEFLGTNQCLKTQELGCSKESACELARSTINSIDNSEKIPPQIAKILCYGMKSSCKDYLQTINR